MKLHLIVLALYLMADQYPFIQCTSGTSTITTVLNFMQMEKNFHKTCTNKPTNSVQTTYKLLVLHCKLCLRASIVSYTGSGRAIV